MRPHDRPVRVWPVLLATAVGLAILVTLGIWQVERLQWKEALLAQLAANAAAAPVDLAAVERLTVEGRDPEFLRVSFKATYKHDSWKKMISTYQGGQGWSIIAPAVTTDGYAVMIDRGRLPGQRLENFDQPTGELQMTGVIRTHKFGQGAFDPDNDPKANLWYWWDVPAMLATSGLPQGLKPFPYVVQLLPGTTDVEFPEPEEPRANLANNHLGYAITWFGLALTLLGVSGFYVWDLRKRT
jgi:surfeit locus 1 family protein